MEPTNKSFWDRPEGKTGMIVLALFAGAGIYLTYKALPFLITLAENTLYFAFLLGILGAVVYMVLDPKIRNLIFFLYKSFVRWLTGLFIQINPIGILRSYIEDLKKNLQNMSKQLGIVKGQMHSLKTLIEENEKTIDNNLKLANKAKEVDKKAVMILKSRKAGRLKESNMKLDELYKKLELLYRVLLKMYENSEIMLEDIEDQVLVKEKERTAIRASHSAMKSAMNIIAGNTDKREMFDQALEAIANDVSMKIGEMERFMELSSNFMQSIDLQNGVFEEEGLMLLEKWEQEGDSLLLGTEKDNIIQNTKSNKSYFNVDIPVTHTKTGHTNQYDDLFKF